MKYSSDAFRTLRRARAGRYAAILLPLLARAASAPAIGKIEPPGWWAVHSVNPVRVLISGSGLDGAIVESGSAHLRPGPLTSTTGGRYAFFDLMIDRATRPGAYTLQVGGTPVSFEVLPPLARTGRFQGFSSDDAIYLIVIDRFANGDAGNDDPAASPGTYDRRNPRFYHGGDLQGIIDRLPYLKDLGVTAIWITPLVDNANRPETDGRGASTEYHGYGAIDLYAVDEHFGAVRKLRELVDKAHRVGLKVIADYVANHVHLQHPWASNPPTPAWFHGDRSTMRIVSGQLWADMDPYGSRETRRHVLDGWFTERLPDLNQDDPEVERYLVQNALWWVGISGLDGIRADTVPYVPASFWNKWNTALRREYPGFQAVGEVYRDDSAALAWYRRAGFGSVFDFPLFFALRRVFLGGAPPRELAASLSHDWMFDDPLRTVTFLGSHDVDRFAESGDTDALRNAWTFLLTTRGIPVIYYGDEIGMRGATDHGARQDFPGGWRGDTRDAFSRTGRTPAEEAVFSHVRKLLHLRREVAALRTGRLRNLVTNERTYVYSRDAAGASVLVAIGAASESDPADAGWREGAAALDLLGSGHRARVRGGRLEIDGPGLFVRRH
jgi:glycosidase